MASQIDDTKPAAGAATTASVRLQFTRAKAEISALQLTAFGYVGQAVIDFGAKPSTTNSAQVAVTGLPLIVATSTLEASLRMEATGDHPLDDLMADAPEIFAGSITPGTGFVIYGKMKHGAGYGQYKINFTVRV